MSIKFAAKFALIFTMISNSGLALANQGQEQTEVIRKFQIRSNYISPNFGAEKDMVQISESSDDSDTVVISLCKVNPQINLTEECRQSVKITKDQLFDNLMIYGRTKVLGTAFNAFQAGLFAMLVGGAALTVGTAGLMTYFILTGIALVGITTFYAFQQHDMKTAMEMTAEKIREQLNIGRSGRPYAIETSMSPYTVRNILLTGSDE